LLQLLGILIAFTAIFLGYVLSPDAETIKDDFMKTKDTPMIAEGEWGRRSDIYFESHGTRCHAWFYQPDKHDTHSVNRPPLIIMAHGFGTQKDMGLSSYAQRFSHEGYAVLLFDYRNFGGSDGVPRNLISPSRHIQDFHAAFEFATTNLSHIVDSSRIILWGTSFGGGHVLVTGADLKNHSSLRGIVSQVPYLDGFETTKRNLVARGIQGSLRIARASLVDIFRSVINLSPVYLKIVGRKDELALMRLSDAEYDEYFSKHPAKLLGGWKNMAPARVALQIGRYAPIRRVNEINVPIFFIGAEYDGLCPISGIKKASELAKSSDIYVRDCHHFQIYRGEHFNAIIEATTAFLKKIL